MKMHQKASIFESDEGRHSVRRKRERKAERERKGLRGRKGKRKEERKG
jgi:hypothetical protein